MNTQASITQPKQVFNLCDELKFKRDIPVRQLPTVRTGSTVVWVENKPYSWSIQNTDRLQILLRDNRCAIFFYSNIAKCIKYLKRTRSREYVIVIVISHSTEIIHKMIYRLRPYRVAQSVYIVSSERNVMDCFSSTMNNITVFYDTKTMFDCLEILIGNIQKENFEGGLFTTFSHKEKALKDIQQERGAFVWNRFFKVVIMSMPCDSLEAKQQMLAECRAYYRSDTIQLHLIDEFERTYQANDAIRWYTKPGFLFYLINKALRSGDVLAMYVFRYFIKDLYNQLQEASAAHSNTSFRLYRGAKLHRNEVESLQIDAIVATNGFFSCSSDRNIAEIFIGIDPSTGKSPSSGREDMSQFILFEIDVDLIKYPSTTVANVSAYSVLPDENEMIFSLGSTFIIQHIFYNNQQSLWIIQMNSFSDLAQLDQEYDRYVHGRVQLTNPIILFGHSLANIKSEYLQSLDYFYYLLRTLSVHHADRPIIHYNLGRIYMILGKYHKSLACFLCARLLLRRQLPQRIFDYCRVLGGIGRVYLMLDDSKRGISRLEQALTLQRKSLPENHTEIPFHLNRLGDGYFKAKQFESALSVFYEADKFFQTRMPTDHKGHGETFHALGLVHRALGDNGKACKYFKEALRKHEHLLAIDHPSVASTCYQLSLIHEDRGEYKIALEYAKRSLSIQSIKLPYYHSELKQSSELVERLQQHQNNKKN